MKGLKKIFLAGILLGVLIIFSTNIISAVCCEKTEDGGTCLNVGDVDYCDDGLKIDGTSFRIDNTACESTQYCSTGTCVDSVAGTCATSSSSACDPSLGGYWYDDSSENIQECEVGCCLIGEGAAFVARTTCNKMGADIAVQPEFRESITTEAECLLAAGATSKGACVFQTESGRECTIETREECPDDRDFHVGLLCSAPELGTLCTMTERTTCVEGKNEVYFVDNCGNPANVYDSDLIRDIPYWTYMKDAGSEEICGSGEANVKSEDCGNCAYGDAGSTCGSANKAGVNPDYGDYVCRDLSCMYKGVKREHGNAWCSKPISYFEDAKPGDLSYRLYCYDGEVQWELCGNLREKLCQDLAEPFGEANCYLPLWQDCIIHTNKKDCLNEKRDCKVKIGTSRKNADGEDILFDNTEDNSADSDDLIDAVCVPRYTPGFNFWEPDVETLGISAQTTPNEVCSAGSVSSNVGYYKKLVGDWRAIEGKCFGDCIEECEEKTFTKTCQKKCFKDCDNSESFKDEDPDRGTELEVGDVDLKKDWVEDRKSLCIVLGDCGVKANYIEKDSYYSWKELFIGDDIRDSSIPGGDNYQ